MKAKKILSVLILLAVLLVTVTGCSEDPIKKDLLNYVNNELPKIASLESNVMDKYSSVTGENYKNDADTYKVLKESVVPDYKTFIDKLEAIKPQTPEVKAVHDIIIAGAKDQYSAFVQFTSAIEKNDADLVTQANAALDKGKSEMKDYQDKLAALAKQHSVELGNKTSK